MALADPGNPATFEGCKLNFAERHDHAPLYALHKDLLRLRREDPVFAAQKDDLEGAVLDGRAFLLRFFDASHGDRLLLVNLGSDLQLSSAPEPLLAPPRESRWEVVFHTDDKKYGGMGAYTPEAADGWRVPGRSAVVLKAMPSE